MKVEHSKRRGASEGERCGDSGGEPIAELWRALKIWDESSRRGNGGRPSAAKKTFGGRANALRRAQ